MKRCSIPVVLITLVAIAVAGVLLGSRPSAGQSADGWRQLSLSEFVRVVTDLTSGQEPLAETLWDEIRSQSVERLLQAVSADTPADYANLVSLFLWARPVLSADQVTTVVAGLEPPANQLRGWTFEKLRSTHTRMTSAQMPDATVHALALTWLAGRDVRTLDDPEQLGWLLGQVQAAVRTASAPHDVSVEWNGTLQAPTDGQYVLSIAPLDLDLADGAEFRRQATRVWVADRQVLDSSAAGRPHRAEAVRLAAAHKTPLRVQIAYASSDPIVFADRPLLAVLYWEAPGLDRRVVPASALATADGQTAGLVVQYTLSRPSGQ